MLSVVNATALSWVASRTFVQGGALRVSRQALALTSLGPLQPILGPQVPSFRDASMFLNETSKGGFSTGLFDGASQLFEFLAPTPNQPVRFSPSASIFRFASSPAALFSFAHTFGDGTTQKPSLPTKMGGAFFTQWASRLQPWVHWAGRMMPSKSLQPLSTLGLGT